MLRPTLLAAFAMAALALEAPASAAPAEVPPPETGLVGLAAGIRFAPQSALAEHARKEQVSVTSGALAGPVVLLPLAYRIDRAWTLAVEFGFGADRVTFSDRDALDFRTFTVGAAVQYALPVMGPRFEPYALGGIGYYLSTVTGSTAGQQEQAQEHNTTGIVLGAGLRMALTSSFGLALEGRHAFAWARAASVGGTSATLGVYWVWSDGGGARVGLE